MNNAKLNEIKENNDDYHVHDEHCTHHHDGFDDTNEPYRREMPKVGRNDPCLCGSEKKYKKCCGR